jgi:hypothetical protein
MIITILRKPVEGTVAENTLKHGCGAINIDATRIGGGVPRQATAGNRTVGWGVQKGGCSYEKGTGVTFTNQGRWPANFILTHNHKEDCELKGTKKIKEGEGKSDKGGTEREVGLYKDGLKKRAKDHHQGEETIPDWACVEGCPVKNLDKQTGVLVSGKDVNPTNSNVSGFFGKTDNYYSSSANCGDRGGASRFFRQFKKDNDQ